MQLIHGTFSVKLAMQSAPLLSPLVLAIIAILLVILFVWLLLRWWKPVQTIERKGVEKVTAMAAAPKAPPAPFQKFAEPEKLVVPPPPAVPEPPAPAVEVTPVAEKAPAAFEAPPAAPVAEDDLVIIEGIGPKIAGLLKQAGITTFAQLAAADPARISQILHAANLHLADPTTWPEQARLAAAGETEALKALQDRLKGGRTF